MIVGLFACDKRHGIAKDGEMPWHCREDLQNFKKLTTDALMVMGRKTWDTLPQSVRRRRCFTISRDLGKASSVETAKQCMDNDAENSYVLGGAETFRIFD